MTSSRNLIGFAFICLVCLLVIPQQAQGFDSACYDPGPDADSSDREDYEDCMSNQEEDDQADRDQYDADRREELDAEASGDSGDSGETGDDIDESSESGDEQEDDPVDRNSQELSEAIQETPASQVLSAAEKAAEETLDAAGKAAGETLEEVLCYERCVDKNIETTACAATTYVCVLWAAPLGHPTGRVIALSACSAWEIICISFTRVYTAVTVCTEVCS